MRNKLAAFTLTEVLMALFISTIIFGAVVSFVFQFQKTFETILASRRQESKYLRLVNILQKDLSKTNAVKLLTNKKSISLKYMVPKLKRSKDRVQGKESLIEFNLETKEVSIEHRYFIWSYYDFIENSNGEKELIQTRDDQIKLDNDASIDFSVLRDRDGVAEIVKLISTTKGKTNTHLFLLGKL